MSTAGDQGTPRRRIAIAFVAIAVVYLLVAALPLPPLVDIALLGVLDLGAALAAVYGAFRATRRAGPVERSQWRWLLAALVLIALAALYLAAYRALVDPRGPSGPTLADVLLIASYIPLFVFAGQTLVRRLNATPTLSRARYTIDAGIALVVLMLSAFVFIVWPLYGPGAAASTAVFGIYPIFDLIVLVGLGYSVVVLPRSAWKRWEIEIGAALACVVVADGIYNILIARGLYAAGSLGTALLQVVYIGGYFLFFASSYDVVADADRVSPPATPDETPSASPSHYRLVDLVPVVVAVVLIPFLFWGARYRADGDVQYWTLMLSATLLGGLVVLRGAVMTMEDRALMARSTRDPLTGVYNHRHFHELLTRATQTASYEGEDLSIAMIDIDDFGSYNNAHGHTAGDQRLREIAEAISSVVRSGDIVCRIGGDVFGLIMPNTSDIEAHRICRAIARRLAATTPPDSPRTTASMGIASVVEGEGSKESLVQQADGALYWAKLNGGNEVVIYDDRVVGFLGPEDRINQVEQQAQLRTVEALAAAVDARDAYTHSHSKSVSVRAVAMGRGEGLDEPRLKLLEMAALLHDVGKIGIPDSVLRKPEKLTEADMEMVWDHPVLGEKILDSTALKEILPWVLSHHERWDGTGYPEGLKSEHIPLEARIIAICDSFDAMTSDRPYRKAMSVDDALTEIIACAGTQFDPRLSRKFVELIREESPAAVRDEEAHPVEQPPGEGTPR